MDTKNNSGIQKFSSLEVPTGITILIATGGSLIPLLIPCIHLYIYNSPTSVGNSICMVSSGNLVIVDACHLLVVISSRHSYNQSRNQEPSWVLLQSLGKFVIFPKKLCFGVAADDWPRLLRIGNQIMLVCESRIEKCRPAIACLFHVEHCWHGILTCLCHDPSVSSSRVPNKASS